MFNGMREILDLVVLYRRRKDVLFAGETSRRAAVRICMEVVVSLVVLVVSMMALLSDEIDAETRKYFSGMAGVVIGYWLR